jgi:hypothetical protein
MLTRNLGAATSWAVGAAAILLGMSGHVRELRLLGMLVALAVFVALAVTRIGPQGIAVALLVAGYLSGWLKIWYGSWIGYALPDGLCLLLLVTTLFRGRSAGLPLPRNGLSSALLLLSAFCVMELLNPLSPMIRSLAGLRSWLLYTWLFFSGYAMLRSRRQVEQIYAVILTLSLLTALYGVSQWRQGPTALARAAPNATLQRYATSLSWQVGTTKSVFRAFSIYVSPAAFGTNMMMGLLIALAVLCRRGGSRRLRGLAIAATPLMAAGLAASGSRTPLVSLVLGMVVILLLHRSRAAMPLILLALIGAVAAANLTTARVGERYASILDLSYATQKWLGPLGAGLGVAGRDPFGRGLGYTAGMPWFLGAREAFGEVETTNVDSGIGAAAAELGIIGTVIFLFLLAQLALCPLRSWRQVGQEDVKALLTAPVAFAIVAAATAVIGSLNAFLPQSIYFWLLIGMVFRAPYLAAEQTGPGAEAGIPTTPGPAVHAQYALIGTGRTT